MYIRTKDGVYEVVGFDEECIIPSLLIKVKNEYGKERITHCCKDDVISQSENLEELCDEFVFVNKVGNFDKSYVIHYNMPNHIFTEPTAKEKIAYIKKYYKDKLDKIKGAIYTDKGLIYVAKMDREGKLVLI